MHKLAKSLGMILCAAVCLGVSGCGGRTSNSSSDAAAPSPAKKWEFFVGQPGPPKGGVFADQVQAIGDDGTIYAPGAAALYAIRPDGTEKWHHDVAGQAADVPVRFVLIDDSGNIWFDTSSADSGAAVRVGPDGKGGEIGSIARATQLGLAYDGTVYMATAASVLQMSSTPKNAGVIWRGYASGMAFSPDDGMVCVPRPDILSRTDKQHTLKWNHKVMQGGLGTPVVANDETTYLPRNGAMDAYGPDGTKKWEFDASGKLTAVSIAEDGTIYFGSDENYLYAVSSAGKLAWKFAAGGAVRSVPAITSNGEVIFGSADHNLYALDSLGAVKWRFAAGGEVFSPTLGSDGTIYFQGSDGKLYAVQDLGENGGLAGQWPKYNGGLRNTARAGK